MLTQELKQLWRRGRNAIWTALGCSGLILAGGEIHGAPPQPNIIFVLADDMGWGDVGCNGQTMIQTPRIDQMRAEGVNFTQAYSGSAVCAPSRYCQLTGFHTGHATVFDFTSGISGANWRIEDAQVPQLLQGAGYETWFTGKWGFGATAADERSPSFTDATDVLLSSELDFVPPRMGWDYSLAFLNHSTAHFYFPDFLWENGTRIPLSGNYHLNYGLFPAIGDRTQYAQDDFHQQILTRITAADGLRPFYAQCSYILPHRETIAPPGFNPYSSTGWPEREQAYAAMISYLDLQIGEIIDAVESNPAIRDNTLIIFTADNGAQFTDGRVGNFSGDNSFFNSNGPFKANKFNLYEGGVRVPFIARWRGHMPAGTTQDEVITFWDFLPTACELAGIKAPSQLDGVSYAPLLTGDGSMAERGAVVFAIEGGATGPGLTTAIGRAVRVDDWKLCVPSGGSLANAELYDLATDPGETNNLATVEPTLTSLMYALLLEQDSGPVAVAPARAELRGDVIALPTPSPAPPEPAVTASTVALWRIDDDGKVAGQVSNVVQDATGEHDANGYGSTIGVTQSPRYVCDVFDDLVPLSHAANALSLSFGSALAQYLQVPDAPELDLTTSPFTIECWVRLRRLATGLTANDRQWILFKKQLGTTDAVLDFGLMAQMSDFALQPGPGKSSGQTGREVGLVFGTGSGSWSLTSTLEINDNEWHYLAVAVDLAEGTARFHLDDTSETLTFVSPSLVGSNNGPLIIGAHHNSSAVFNQFLEGALDEIRISRAALDADALQCSPQAGHPVRRWILDFGDVEAGGPTVTRHVRMANAASGYANLIAGEFTATGLTDARLNVTTGTYTGLADGAESPTFSIALAPTSLGALDERTTMSARTIGHGALAVDGLNTIDIRAQVLDRTAPVLTLNGASTQSLAIGSTFVDPGAMAHDSFEGDLSASVTRTGVLDTSQRGDWILTYHVADGSGNAATPVTRTVRVVGPELEAPSQVSFADVNVTTGQTSGTQTILLRNVGETDLYFVNGSIDWPGLTLSGSTAFEIIDTIPSTTLPLAPGANLTITLRFEPPPPWPMQQLGSLEVSWLAGSVRNQTIDLMGKTVPVELSEFKLASVIDYPDRH